jgi:molybdopterin synthase catalytic subunit
VSERLPHAEVSLCDVRETALSVDEVLSAVRHPESGGIALFIGLIRDHDHGESVSSLDYTAHPGAADAMREVCERVARERSVARVAAVHRTGHLEVGDLAVVVGVSAAHRGDAIDACREVIDTLKATVPIWKHQLFTDGRDEWVGLP